MIQDFFPGEEEGGLRIDKYLSPGGGGLKPVLHTEALKGGPGSGGGPSGEGSFQVEEDMRITLDVPEAVQPDIEPEPMDLDIVYEDEDVILINKPKGMVVHPAAGHYSHTLVNGLLYHCRGQLSGINGGDAAGDCPPH